MKTHSRVMHLALLLVVALLPALPGAAQTPGAEPPVLLTPENGAFTTGASDPPIGLPTLRWAPVPGATRYHVQISTSAGFASALVDADTYATAYAPTLAFADGAYYWRVKTMSGSTWGAYSEIWSFQKDWSAGGTIVPGLLSPPPNAERASFAHDDFTWTPTPGAAYYIFQISPDPAFSSITYSAQSVKQQHTPTARLANNTYYWRVIPVDRRGNAGAASETGSFTFNWNLAPALLAPADADDDPVSAGMQFLPRFSWTAVEAAREYRLEISTQPDFSTSLTAYTTDQTDYTPERNLANDQDYYWRVRATDYGGINGPWSEVRHFRMRWNFHTRLLTPLNNLISMSYPFFSWTPIPGAERYQIQISESTAFNSFVADKKIYNVTAHTQPEWRTLKQDTDYYWRVRALDGQGNLTPWSDMQSFRPLNTLPARPEVPGPYIRPSQIYPPYYYPPDATNTPVHSDRTIAWPLFMWDTAHIYTTIPGTAYPRILPPDFYELTVDDDPALGSPNFQVQTSGLAAAPTIEHPFDPPLADGQLYYWRVRAYREGAQLGLDSVWVTRFDSTLPESADLQVPMTGTIALIHPANGFEAVGTPPVLGWQPVTGAQAYAVEIRRGPDFDTATTVEQAETATIHFVPWQGRQAPLPFGTYWWRVRSLDPDGDWSAPRRFNLSTDLIAGNPYDGAPPAKPGSLLAATATYDPLLTFIDAGTGEAGAFGLGALHVMLDRTYTPNYNWVIAFGTGANEADALRYGLYFDIDHAAGSGAASDPLGKPIHTATPYLPEFVLYVNRGEGNNVSPANALFYRWNGAAWNPPQTLISIGGDVWLDAAANAVQALIPYTALGPEDPKAAGSLALTVFTTTADPADGALTSVPIQDGAALGYPAFVSDMLLPLYPFDTPLSDPIIFDDMPALRWRMPYADSVDGYQVQVARDPRFTQIVETWESFESGTWPYYAVIPAAFQSMNAYEDNASYYWRVRIRHERYTDRADPYDSGPWSPAMRFRLDSRLVKNVLPLDGTTSPATPTFTWDRIEGASGYKLQLDNDSNFSSPLINRNIDGTSFTPTDALADGTYYWRVAMRRSSNVIGHWTPALSFVKRSVAPAALSPAYDALIAQQPTFTWAAVLTPTLEPRLAAPRYRVQISADPNFSSPRAYDTPATSYTLAKGQSLADGTWYWRVAVLDANNQPGAYGPTQRFYKEYTPPMLLAPAQGSSTMTIPTFRWSAVNGAAQYRIQYADNALFLNPATITTDNASYTPTGKLAKTGYYWRVRMEDVDNNPGPYEVGRVWVGSVTYLPMLWQ